MESEEVAMRLDIGNHSEHHPHPVDREKLESMAGVADKLIAPIGFGIVALMILGVLVFGGN